jgi:hypothetical protein
MPDPIPYERYPWWVKVSLAGLPTRGAVRAFAWLCLVTAPVGCAWAAWAGYTRWYACALFVVAALLYEASVRWVDRHGSWPAGRA